MLYIRHVVGIENKKIFANLPTYLHKNAGTQCLSRFPAFLCRYVGRIANSTLFSFEELRKSLNSKDMIGSTARFPATMHGKDGIAHIDTSQLN